MPQEESLLGSLTPELYGEGQGVYRLLMSSDE